MLIQAHQKESRLMAKFKMCWRPQPILKSALTSSELTEIFPCFTHSLKENVVADLVTGGSAFTVILPQSIFLIRIKIFWPQRPEHAVYNTVNSPINRGIKCKKHSIICYCYNFITFKFLYIFLFVNL